MVNRQRTKSKVITVSLTPGQAIWIFEKATAEGLTVGEWLKAFVWEHRGDLKPVKGKPHGELKTEKIPFRLSRQQYQALQHYAQKLGWNEGLSGFISYSLFPVEPNSPRNDGRRKPPTPEERAEFKKDMTIIEKISQEWAGMVERKRNPAGSLQGTDGTRYRLQRSEETAKKELEMELGMTQTEWFRRRDAQYRRHLQRKQAKKSA